MQKKMKILAIETSCDETSVAIVKATTVVGLYKFEILSNIVLSQIKTHARWGGVVPSLAKREHQANLIPILIKALKKSRLLISSKSQITNHKQILNSKFKTLNSILEREPELLKQFLEFMPKIKSPKVDAIAVTVGPGLEPALWVGINFAKALSLVWNKPIIAVNHMEGHIVASLLKLNLKSSAQGGKISKIIKFPAFALLVSGGHTELVFIKKWGDYKIIGETRDDAAGECFDKTARMLGLPYPGGPEIAKLASQSQSQNLKIHLPRPMIDSKNYDFSFSGLKTAVLYLIRDLSEAKKYGSRRISRYDRPKENHILGEATIAAICGEFQQVVIDVLIAKTIKAAKEFKAKTIILGGGVAANKELRKQMAAAIKKNLFNVGLRLPAYKLTTDNAAMIAAAGYLRALNNDFAQPVKIKAQGNLTFK